jgi:formylglycine-generating enzyme required for sulfatase activity
MKRTKFHLRQYHHCFVREFCECLQFHGVWTDLHHKTGIHSWPETFVNPRDGSTMRLVPSGKFTMGSTQKDIENARSMDKDGWRFALSHERFALSHETPQVELFVPAFYISVFTVTNEQFARFLSELLPETAMFGPWADPITHICKPSQDGESYRVEPGFERHPVVHVSWHGASAYCRWAGLRLPTEVEWEKAARRTDARLFPWGDQWHDCFLCWRHGHRRGIEPTAVVDAHPQGCSPYGIYQMAGNVAEWCEDWYQPRIYDERSMSNRFPPFSGDERVLRGGTCLQRNKLEFRCAMRQASPAVALTVDFTGIRCACDAPELCAASVPPELKS